MRVLITGVTGFAGSHLAEYALSKGAEVFGSYRWRSKTDNIDHLRPRIELIECELKDASSVNALVHAARPDYIFHLAAQSFVPSSWSAPVETMNNNITCQVNLLEAVRSNGRLSPRIQIACSSEEYGLVYENEVPISETNPLRPLSPYAVSKVAQDLIGYQYHKNYGLQIIRTRGFNHTGPRRGEVFVTSNFAKQIAEIEAGKKEPTLHTGNLESKRDFTDVRDMIRAYWLALEHGEPGEVYNICSGKAWAIKEVLDILLSFSKVDIRTEQDPQRMRPSDVLILLGDNTKFTQRTGWKPEVPLETTLRNLLDYWRERV